jgi:hypothetical protein
MHNYFKGENLIQLALRLCACKEIFKNIMSNLLQICQFRLEEQFYSRDYKKIIWE